ncbi:MAG TPA: hypothetical protein VI039_09985 [Solirubrobacterales bacterium]
MALMRPLEEEKMKSLKMLGLLTVAAAALTAFGPASASATVLTSPAGSTYTGTLSAKAIGEVVFHGFVTHTCKNSVIEAQVEQHGSLVTAAGKVNKMTFTECGSTHIAVIKPGTLEIHTDTATANGNGTVTLSGVEITYVLTSIFGSIHCTMIGNQFDLGTLTGSKNTGATARIGTQRISDPTSFFCPTEVDWTASYEFTTPDYLDVD